MPETKIETTSRSSRPNPLRGFNFIVRFYDTNIKNYFECGFTRIFGLKLSNNIFEIKHTDKDYGGTIISKFPGNITYSPVTFEKGVIPYTNKTSIQSNRSNQFYLFDRLGELLNLPNGKQFFKFNILILLYDYKGHIPTRDSLNRQQKIWGIRNAQIQDVEFGTLDANSNDILINKFIIVHEGIKYDYCHSLGKNELFDKIPVLLR